MMEINDKEKAAYLINMNIVIQKAYNDFLDGRITKETYEQIFKEKFYNTETKYIIEELRKRAEKERAEKWQERKAGHRNLNH